MRLETRLPESGRFEVFYVVVYDDPTFEEEQQYAKAIYSVLAEAARKLNDIREIEVHATGMGVVQVTVKSYTRVAAVSAVRVLRQILERNGEESLARAPTERIVRFREHVTETHILRISGTPEDMEQLRKLLAKLRRVRGLQLDQIGG